MVASRDVVWRLTELLMFLTKLADCQDDRIRYELYERYSLKTYISRILFNGNSIEKEHALKLLWKLTLDKHVASYVRADLNLYSFLVGLSMNQFNRNRMLIKYANCILFALNSAPDLTSAEPKPVTPAIVSSSNSFSSSTSSSLSVSPNRRPNNNNKGGCPLASNSENNNQGTFSSSSIASSYSYFITEEIEYLKI